MGRDIGGKDGGVTVEDVDARLEVLVVEHARVLQRERESKQMTNIDGLVPAHSTTGSEIGILVPNNRRQHSPLHTQKDVRPHALWKLLCPVSAALASIFRMDSISISYPEYCTHNASHARSDSAEI